MQFAGADKEMEQINLMFTSDQNLFLFLLFVVFLIFAYRTMKLVYRTVIMFLLGAVFPFVANSLLGISVNTDLYTVLRFGVLSAILYLLYIEIRFGYSVLKTTYKLFKLLLRPISFLLTIPKLLFSRNKRKKKGDENQSLD